MKLLMCRCCGEFVQATRDGDDWVPTPDACPGCDGASFKNVSPERDTSLPDEDDRDNDLIRP